MASRRHMLKLRRRRFNQKPSAVSAGLHWSWWLIVIVAGSLVGVAVSPTVPDAVFSAIKSGGTLSYIDRNLVDHKLGAASANIISASTWLSTPCSTSEPCWPAIGKGGEELALSLTDPTGAKLDWWLGFNVISKYIGGKGGLGNALAQGTNWLPLPALRRAVLAVDPTAFFYGYVRDGKIHAMAPPLDGRLVSVCIACTRCVCCGAGVLRSPFHASEIWHTASLNSQHALVPFVSPRVPHTLHR